MTCGAISYPGSKLMSCAAIMGSFAVIADVFGNLFPLRAVPCTGTCQRMGDLVEKDLVDFIIFIFGRKIF
jgi:hypothetical protein